jgi:hypothetical protein
MLIFTYSNICDLDQSQVRWPADATMASHFVACALPYSGAAAAKSRGTGGNRTRAEVDAIDGTTVIMRAAVAACAVAAVQVGIDPRQRSSVRLK